MKRLKIKFKHKLAWHLRKLAEWLEPSVLAPRIDAPIIIGRTEYERQFLKIAIDPEPFDDKNFNDLQIIQATRQLGKAGEKFVEVKHNQPGPGGNNRTIVQLLILKPVDHV